MPEISRRGDFPVRAQRLVLEWAALHKEELLENWSLARQRQPLRRIAPLEWLMDYDDLEARYVGGYVTWLRFRDGTAGEIDLERELHGPVFEPLREPAVFREFAVHPEFQTLVWPNGADFAPEFLHDTVRVTA